MMTDDTRGLSLDYSKYGSGTRGGPDQADLTYALRRGQVTRSINRPQYDERERIPTNT